MQLGECDINDVLLNRQNQKKKYSEQEIIYIIQHLVKGLLEGIAHKNKKLQNFHLTKEKNGGYLFKKSSHYSKNFEDPNRIPLNTMNGYRPFYADPLILAYFLIEKYAKKNFIFKKEINGDIFSLGIIILSLMGLEDDEIKKIKENLDKYEFEQKYKDNYSRLCLLVRML